MIALEIGQTLWFVPAPPRRGTPRELTVTAVGRKWATLDNNSRVNIATMWIDGNGFSSPGRCWPSAEIYEIWSKCTSAWNDLRWQICSGGPPQDMTVERVREAAALLGISLGKTS